MNIRQRNLLRAESDWLRKQAEYANSDEKTKALERYASMLKRALNVSPATRRALIDKVNRGLRQWGINLKADGPRGDLKQHGELSRGDARPILLRSDGRRVRYSAAAKELIDRHKRASAKKSGVSGRTATTLT